MATVRELREGLAANLAPIGKLGVQISPYILSSPTPPTIWVYPAEHDYHRAFRDGLSGHFLTVEAVVTRNADIAQQRILDEFLEIDGPRSVKAAVESDPTLGGLCEDLIVRSAGGYTQIDVEGQGPFISVTWRVEILNS